MGLHTVMVFVGRIFEKSHCGDLKLYVPLHSVKEWFKSPDNTLCSVSQRTKPIGARL